MRVYWNGTLDRFGSLLDHLVVLADFQDIPNRSIKYRLSSERCLEVDSPSTAPFIDTISPGFHIYSGFDRRWIVESTFPDTPIDCKLRANDGQSKVVCDAAAFKGDAKKVELEVLNVDNGRLDRS